ncbi:hypothetical protein D3C85_802930 [compost metagenome]
MHAVTGANQIDPVRVVQLGQQVVELGNRVRLQWHMTHTVDRCVPQWGKHHHLLSAVGLLTKTFEGVLQRRQVTFAVEHDRHDARTPAPTLHASIKQALLGRIQMAAGQPLPIHVSETVAIRADPGIHQGLNETQLSAKGGLFPRISLPFNGIGQRNMTHPTGCRRRLAAAQSEHLLEPVEFGHDRSLDCGLVAQARRMQTLKTQDLPDHDKIAASQQTREQSKIQVRNKALADLRQGRQVFQCMQSSQQGPTEATEKIKDSGFQNPQQILTLEQGDTFGKAAIFHTVG